MTSRHWEFAEWLKEQLEQRGWRQADLAKESGLDSGVLSRIMSGERNAGIDVCRAIAKALDLPPEEVFRRAGLLPPKPPRDERIERIVALLAQLSDEAQSDVEDYARLKLRQHEERKRRKGGG